MINVALPRAGHVPYSGGQRSAWARWHVDWPLLAMLVVLCACGLVVLYSAAGGDESTVYRQGIRLSAGLVAMLLIANIRPDTLRRWSPWLFVGGLALLLAVLLVGVRGGGAQRWLDLGFMRFQPSELVKLATPMMLAWYLSERRLPPRLTVIGGALLLICVPAVLIFLQPDLGTAILVAMAGLFVLFLAGLSWKLIGAIGAAVAIFAPVAWFFLLHDYQRNRVLTLFNPERDPLGTGYHIIQSKIAIGSGGVWGKGWMEGTQSQLQFLPERTTDFIFAVLAEEFGWIGALLLLALYVLIILRGLYIASQGQDTYSRLLAGALTLVFGVYVIVNTAMVSGLLPVVGIPLPLISYGGTSMVTLMVSFGILMSIHTHKKLLPS